MSVVVSLQSKVCSKCKEVKLLEEFNKKFNTKDGHRSNCKLCQRLDRIKYRENYPDRIRESNAKRHAIKNLNKHYVYNSKSRLRIGVVYLLRDKANKGLKLGFTTNLKLRLSNHLSSNPFLVLVDVIVNVTIQLEQEIHTKLNFQQIPGTREWYKDSSLVLSLFADYKIKCKLESDLTD